MLCIVHLAACVGGAVYLLFLVIQLMAENLKNPFILEEGRYVLLIAFNLFGVVSLHVEFHLVNDAFSSTSLVIFTIMLNGICRWSSLRVTQSSILATIYFVFTVVCWVSVCVYMHVWRIKQPISIAGDKISPPALKTRLEPQLTELVCPYHFYHFVI